MTTTTRKRTRGVNQQTAIAGELFVAAELTKRGWIATLTAKNTAAIDILASRPPDEDPTGQTVVRIDVKTGRKVWSSFQVGGIHLSGPQDFIVVVALGEDNERPRYWVVPAQVAADLTREYVGPKYTRTVLPLRDIEEYEEAWELLEEGS